MVTNKSIYVVVSLTVQGPVSFTKEHNMVLLEGGVSFVQERLMLEAEAAVARLRANKKYSGRFAHLVEGIPIRVLTVPDTNILYRAKKAFGGKEFIHKQVHAKFPGLEFTSAFCTIPLREDQMQKCVDKFPRWLELIDIGGF